MSIRQKKQALPQKLRYLHQQLTSNYSLGYLFVAAVVAGDVAIVLRVVRVAERVWHSTVGCHSRI